MFRKVSGLVLALALVMSGAGVLLGPPTLAHAGGGQERAPSIEWFNPSSMMYGGWNVTTGIYLKNPTGVNLKFNADVWFNGATVDPYSVYVRTASWSNVQIDQVNCDVTGCLGKASGTVPAYGRVYAIFSMVTGRTLGTNMTVGSVRAAFENFDYPIYAEGHTNFIEGPRFSASIALDETFSTRGGYKPLVIEATDKTLNNFQLLGVGTDCANAVVPDYGYSTRYDLTTVKWYTEVYVPDNVVGKCTITALIKTRDTVISATLAVNPS